MLIFFCMRDELMEEYIGSIEMIAQEHCILRQLDPNNELLRLVVIKRNGAGSIIEFAGFEEKYPLTKKLDRKEWIKQHRTYQRDLNIEIYGTMARQGTWRL